ncbi:MAG TPA: cyclase family protein [Terriglobales bacterium]|nr:cyclase family protein [Terriglobales bacterium]
MKFQTLVIGYCLALALFLFAQHRPELNQSGAFHHVEDLTHAIETTSGQSSVRVVPAVQRDPRTRELNESPATRIIAPAQAVTGLWSVDQIPAGRLVAPLVILDITNQMRNQIDYQISVEDIARWEHVNGEIPLGSVVIARTGWLPTNRSTPRFSQDAALFLVEGRKILGLGSDAPFIDSRSSGISNVYRYALSHSIYYLENVANLDRLPDRGAVVVVAPTKIKGRTAAPARIMALVQ